MQTTQQDVQKNPLQPGQEARLQAKFTSDSWYQEILDGDWVFMDDYDEYWYGKGFWV